MMPVAGRGAVAGGGCNGDGPSGFHSARDPAYPFSDPPLTFIQRMMVQVCVSVCVWGGMSNMGVGRGGSSNLPMQPIDQPTFSSASWCRWGEGHPQPTASLPPPANYQQHAKPHFKPGPMLLSCSLFPPHRGSFATLAAACLASCPYHTSVLHCLCSAHPCPSPPNARVQ